MKWIEEREEDDVDDDDEVKKAHKLTTWNTVLQMRSKCVTMYVLAIHEYA